MSTAALKVRHRGLADELRYWSPTSATGSARYQRVKAAATAMRAEGLPLVASDVAKQANVPETSTRAILRTALLGGEEWYTEQDKAAARAAGYQRSSATQAGKSCPQRSAHAREEETAARGMEAVQPRGPDPDCACCGSPAAYATDAGEDSTTGSQLTISWCARCWDLLQAERAWQRRGAPATFERDHPLPAWRLAVRLEVTR